MQERERKVRRERKRGALKMGQRKNGQISYRVINNTNTLKKKEKRIVERKP